MGTPDYGSEAFDGEICDEFQCPPIRHADDSHALWPLTAGKLTMASIMRFNLKTLLLVTALFAAGFCRLAHRMRREQATGRDFAPWAAKIVARPRAFCGIALGNRITGLEFRERSSKATSLVRFRTGRPASVEAMRRGPIELDDGTILGGLCDLDWHNLDEMPCLTDLAIDSNTLTDECLMEIAALAQLKSLRLNCRRITNAGVERLASLTGLESLELSSEKFTDAGVARLLSSLPRLTKLHVHGPVGSKTVSAVCAMPSLSDLTLQSWPLGRFVDSDAMLLQNAAALRSITILGDFADCVAIRRALQRAKPNATVVVTSPRKFLPTSDGLGARIYHRR
jgi:hypothetical protein